MSSIKKSILFVNESLACAGGEKSLLNLLSAIDYDRFNVDLQLFSYGKPWDKLVDPHVRILPPLPYTLFLELSLPRAIAYALRHRKLHWLRSRLAYTFALRIKKNLGNVKKSILYWRTQSECFDPITNNYDYVIGYAQGIPTFYVSDKAEGYKRLAWINATYLPPMPEKRYIEEKYQKIDIINSVTEELGRLECNHWPLISNKSVTFRDIINPQIIYKMAEDNINIKKDSNKLTIVTLGRLTLQKGYDMCLEAARILKENKIDYCWYILGEGPYREDMERFIQMYGLSDFVILLGVKANPYPYLKLGDIYVQASRREGFGLAIAEARLLNIPVVTTRFNTVFMQMIDGKNGLVTDMSGEAVAEAIMRLHNDKELYNSIRTFLEKEAKGNVEIIDDFYRILER